MKILHLINGLGTGGAEMLVVDLANAMRSHGHQVRIACLSEVAGVPADKARRLGLDVVSLAKHRYDPTLPLRIAGIGKGADVVHAHLFPAFYWAALAPMRTPVLFTEHNTWNRRMDHAVFAAVDRWIYRKLERIIAISEGTQTQIEKHLRLKAGSVPVISNGISDGLVAGPAAARAGGRRMIIVASLENRRKDINRAVRATAAVPGSSLSIVGEGPDRAEIEALISELGVSDRVSLLGRRSDVPDLLRQHDLFLSTSKVEGFGLAAAEGMAVGLPVVAPRIPGISEVVTHDRSGLLFDPQDPAEPAASITAVFEDPGLADRLAREGRIEAAKFTANTCASNYEREYQALVKTVS